MAMAWPSDIALAHQASSPEKDSETAEQHLENARGAIKAGDFSRAKNQLKRRDR
jgi:hypothetical protein